MTSKPPRAVSAISFAADFGLPPPLTPMDAPGPLARPAAYRLGTDNSGKRMTTQTSKPIAARDSVLFNDTEQLDDMEVDSFSLAQGVCEYEEAASIFETLVKDVKSGPLFALNEDGADTAAASTYKPVSLTEDATADLTQKGSFAVVCPRSRTSTTIGLIRRSTAPVHPLLKPASTTICTDMSSPKRNYGTMPPRPRLPHAYTTALPLAASTDTTPATGCSNTATKSSLPRPPISHSATAAPPTARPAARPGLFRKLTASITSALDLNSANSHSQRHRPAPPSHWTDHAHRATLLKTWDAVREAASTSAPSAVSAFLPDYTATAAVTSAAEATPSRAATITGATNKAKAKAEAKLARSTTSQLQTLQRAMLVAFPELGTGDVLLEREWMEYVLGMGLRQPFCSGRAMGRWEVLGGITGPGNGAGAWGMY